MSKARRNPSSKHRNAAVIAPSLLALFDTSFLQTVLTTILREVPAKHHVQHVGSVESWPMQLNRNNHAAMIFNTHYRNEAGEHWVAVYIDGATHEGFIFDSMPLRVFPKNVLSKLNRVCDVVHNINKGHFVLQHPLFPLCGLYCLTFLERFSKSLPLILCPTDPLQNDVDVLEHMWNYIEQLFK